jgi:hypothetical protein
MNHPFPSAAFAAESLRRHRLMEAAWFNEAYEFGLLAHAGQVDKGGNQYFLHCARVAGLAAFIMEDGAFSPEHRRAGLTAALLHDTIEDTNTTLEILAERFSPRVAFMVKALSHVPGRPYLPWIESFNSIGCDPILPVIKISDVCDNLSPERQHPERAQKARDKYLPAGLILADALPHGAGWREVMRLLDTVSAEIEVNSCS